MQSRGFFTHRKCGLVFFIGLTLGLFCASIVTAETDCTQESTTGIPQSECEALVALYNSTDGPNWTQNTNWNTTTSVGDNWYGVSVSSGHVAVLFLDENNLSGTIPPEISNLPNLAILDFHSNKLNGDIPAVLANLNNLFSLDLGYNKLSASDPTLLNFLAAEDPDWADTQTVPPTNVTAFKTAPDSMKVSWTPIAYTADSGYYRVMYAADPGGTYSEGGIKSGKAASELIVTLPSFDTAYLFTVETVTLAHPNHPSDLTSESSQPVLGQVLPGDIHVDGDPNLIDVILVLKIVSGIDTGTAVIDTDADVDQDGRIGLENAVYILREMAELIGQSVTEYTGQSMAGPRKTATSDDAIAIEAWFVLKNPSSGPLNW